MAKPVVLELKDEEIKAVEEFAAATKSVREFERVQAVLYKGNELGADSSVVGCTLEQHAEVHSQAQGAGDHQLQGQA
jgi:hypothetical protein